MPQQKIINICSICRLNVFNSVNEKSLGLAFTYLIKERCFFFIKGASMFMKRSQSLPLLNKHRQVQNTHTNNNSAEHIHQQVLACVRRPDGIDSALIRTNSIYIYPLPHPTLTTQT